MVFMETHTIIAPNPGPLALSAEIIILIIEEIAEQRSDKDFCHALLACSSVSHFFHSVSQPHVFAVVDYNNSQPLSDDLVCARETSLKNLLDVLESKPYLGQFIREFHLHVDEELRSGACIATVACILGYCRKFELFYFHDTGFGSWTFFPNALSCALEEIFRYNDLLSLTLLNVGEFPPYLFALCPTIKRLQLFNIAVDVPRKNYFRNGYAGAIESLHFTGLHDGDISRMLSSGFDFSPLRHLKSWLFEREAHNMLWTILDKCNRTLETLECFFTAQYTMENLNALVHQNVPNHLLSPQPFNFKNLTALRALSLRESGTVQDTVSWGSLMQHFLVKCSVAQNVTIKEIVFHVERLRYPRDDFPQNEIIIDSLEMEHIQHALLDRGGFTALRRVVLSIQLQLVLNDRIQPDWSLLEEEKESYIQRLKERLAKLNSTSRFELLFDVHTNDASF